MATNQKLNQDSYRPASALLLTVMIIAIISTTTLSSIAIRFDQLSATDRIANAQVAKSAADSALVKLKEQLVANTDVKPTLTDLDANTTDTTKTAKEISTYRPNPRKIVATYQKAQGTLPRCLAVAALIPWTNDGQYQFSQQDSSNPVMLFSYANIVNDTPLGIIPGNGNLGGPGDTTEKQTTISQLTNMGHFYNPYAPVGASQNSAYYWTIKLGGPQDQFLTRKASDGTSSYYKNMDFFYLPYLPRWQDTGLNSITSGSGFDRIKAVDLQSKFESTIKSNNFKIWIDASVTDSQISQYGFGDLFTGDSNYRLKWLQPSLWNDSPEADLLTPGSTSTGLMTPYRADNVAAPPGSSISWTKKSQPLMTVPPGNSSGWNTAIVKGSKSFSFIKLNSSQNETKFCPPTLGSPTCPAGTTITGSIYGSLEGIRLNQAMTFVLLDKSLSPLNLVGRGQDQGRFYSVVFTAVSNGVESVNVTFELSSDPSDTPKLNTTPTPRAATWADMDTIVVLAGPQYSTFNSNKSVTINADPDGVDVTVNINSTCQPTGGALSACPAVGDLIDLTKPESIPVWGKVTKTTFSNDGKTLVSIVVDQLRKSPLPTREMAYTYYTSGGAPRIAYYGGAIDMNSYDGGYASESNQLWIYDPEADSWEFKAPGAVNPGPRAGASMVYDSVNDRLVMVGGYYHEPVVVSPNSANCEITQSGCLYTNRPGLRVAKRVTNDVYAFKLGGLGVSANTWSKIDYPVASLGKIESNKSYTVRVTSTLADRSGLERWNMTAKTASANQTQVIKVSPTDNKTFGIVLYPSVAGVAKGDEVYYYGSKSSDSSGFYGWGKIDNVNYSANTVDLVTYGYKGDETTVTMKSLAIQVVKRQIATTTCVGGSEIGVGGSYYFCTFSSNDTTGYAVGDSVVLEKYADDNSQLTGTLSGFISYIDPAGKAYFVADERNPLVEDFSDQTAGKIAGESAVAFPSARYGAAMALQPKNPNLNCNLNVSVPNCASYWQGAAKNLNNNHRFADLWNVNFVAGSGPASVVWSFQPTNNPIDSANLNALNNNTYAFQVVRPDYTYQLATTSNSENNPSITKTDASWDNSRYWPLQIDPADAGKIVVGAWATIERRIADGSREVFHGIVGDIFNSQSCVSGSDSDSKLCLRHNSAYPNDSGLTGSSANAKVTMTPTFRTDTITGGIFKGVVAPDGSGTVSLSNVPDNKLGEVPGAGALVQIWKQGSYPSNGYTLTVNNRTFNPANKTFSFNYDKLTATPDSQSFSTSQIASQTGVDRIVTITDSQMAYTNKIGAPEWIKDTSTGGWQIRQSGAYSNYLYRPANRRAGAMATLYDVETRTTSTYLAGGTLGSYATLWRMQDSGSTSNSAVWDPRFVSANAANDLPNLAGGSLVVYKWGANTRAVFMGGKQKLDLSSDDYGRVMGPYINGRPDSGTFSVSDNSYFADDTKSNGTDAQAFVKTIETNLPDDRPAGVVNSLGFVGGNILPNPPAVCAYLGQATGCSSKQLLSQLGELGRNSQADTTHNGWTYGHSAVLNELGASFKQQNGTGSASLIMSIPTMSGAGINGRFEQEGYRPYICDKNSPGCSFAQGKFVVYGTLTTNFGSDKTGAIAAYTTMAGGGAILATSAAVGAAVVNNRGGSNGTATGLYSYCAASEIVKKVDGTPDLNDDGTYKCQPTATRYLPTLPDAEDLLFTLNAALALSATDTYKIVGYYGGVKRGYLVISRSGSQPTVYEVAP
ncbi:MAG: hypothetical protein AAB774_02830 [Patescibacteria group bacterium]